MIAIGFLLLAWSVFLSWAESKNNVSYPEWFNLVLGAMILIGFILVSSGLAVMMWEWLP